MGAETIEMLKVIIPAVLSAVVALVVAGQQNKTTVAQINQEHNEQLTLILYRLDQLEKKFDKQEKKLDEHNNFMKRLGILEAKVEMYHSKGEANGAK